MKMQSIFFGEFENAKYCKKKRAANWMHIEPVVLRLAINIEREREGGEEIEPTRQSENCG